MRSEVPEMRSEVPEMMPFGARPVSHLTLIASPCRNPTPSTINGFWITCPGLAANCPQVVGTHVCLAPSN
eukprot:2281235-Rhodomonas_salina.6